MNVLVTGGCGFIGSNLIEQLEKIENITKIYCVDDLSSPRDDVSQWTNFRKKTVFLNCCFSSKEALALVASGEINYVFHAAAIPRVSFSVENPSKTTETNISKTVALMEACVGNIKRFIFSSSSSVYGGADLLPTPATYEKKPKSPYAWQKSSIEELLSIFCNIYENFDAVSLRYFNVFGPGQFGGSAYATAISAWCHAIKNGTPLRSDGTGEQSRDLCYVENVVQANILAMKVTNNFSGSCFNVACGDRISNNQILQHFKQKFAGVEINHAPFRTGDVMHTHADISETKSQLGYEPTVGFWKGLEKTFEWWKLNNLNSQ